MKQKIKNIQKYIKQGRILNKIHDFVDFCRTIFIDNCQFYGIIFTLNRFDIIIISYYIPTRFLLIFRFESQYIKKEGRLWKK